MRAEDPLKIALAQLKPKYTLANVLETPKAVEYRNSQRQVEALKIRSEKKRERELQQFMCEVRAQEKAEKNRQRTERQKKAKRLASRAGVYVPKDKRKQETQVVKQTIQEELNVLRSHIKTLEGTISELSRENSSLKSVVVTMQHERESLVALTTSLSELKAPSVEGLVSSRATNILTKICIDSQYQPSPEEALLCVTALYGNRVHVLDTAWESARKLAYYANGRRLLSLLMRLATRYIDAMAEGGDGLARQVFTLSEFSTRESDTVMRSKTHVKARTWIYQNREVTMQRHLKIGVSTDTKLAIRVYFDYLPDLHRVVIGWCGEHRPIPGVTS